MIKAENLRKQYATVLAVDDVSLEVHRGRIFGLIGPNGAGKTTTIRMLLNIITPDRGKITFDGAPFSQRIQDRIGYVPEERGLYKKNKLIDTILYFASLRGVVGSVAKKSAMEWLRRFDLEMYAKKKVEELSKGNQQKVQFITAILHNPDFVVLDEPFSGLDPVNQIVLKDIFQEMKQQGKAIIFSTHQMDSAEKLCDEICLINRGSIVLEGSLKEVKQKFGKNSVHVEFEGDGSFIASLPVIKKATVYANYAELQLNGDVSTRDLLGAISSKVEIRKFEFLEPSLNSIFLDVVGVSPETDHETTRVVPQVQKPKTIAGDRRVRNAKFSLLMTFLAAVIVTAIMLLRKQDASWSLAVLFLVVVIASLLKYLKVKKTVTLELQRESQEPANVQ